MTNDTVLTYLDSYCERAGDASLWAEPFNAVTNLFFMLAALWGVRMLLAAKPAGKTYDVWVLVAALFGIGIGSGLWHMRPTGVTVLMDVIPISIFMNVYLVAALRRLCGLVWRKVWCWWGLYQVLTFGGQLYLPSDLLHGTVMYLPTYIAMVALTFGLARRDVVLGRSFAMVTTVWSLSLICRTVDLEICPQFPIGTHFLWHMLNAWVLYRLLQLLIARLPRI